MMTDEEHAQRNQLVRQEIAEKAVCRTLNGKLVQIFIFWRNSQTRQELRQALRDAYFLGEQDPWPEGIEVIEVATPTPHGLLLPLDAGNLNPQDRYRPGRSPAERKAFAQAWDNQMRLSRRQKTRAWESYLKEQLEKTRPSSRYQLAFVELIRYGRDVHQSQEIKGAVRAACINLGLGSQMMYPTKLDKEGKTATESLSRAKSAVADLVQRQTGVLYDSPVELYRRAGIPADLAGELSIIALYKLSGNRPRINFPVGVHLRPNGQLEMLLPGHGQDWQPYLDATQEVGRIFRSRRKEEILLEAGQQAEFAAQILTQQGNRPTLVLLDAADWRQYNVLPQFANRTPSDTSLRKDTLELGHIRGYQQMYRQADLPNLRIIRMRTAGSLGETPQYIALSPADLEDMEEVRDLGYLAGFEDTQAGSKFFHYFSIGQLPKTARRQKRGVYKLDDGGGIAFKHQTIIEFVPFFLQRDDEPKAWCRVPHFLRFSPAWDGGNTVLPYPMHLAQAALQDQLCLLDESGGEEE